jgi:hypothetical protein
VFALLPMHAFGGDIEFTVGPSPKSPIVKTLGRWPRATDLPSDPADVVLRITVQGNERLAQIVHHITINPEALPKEVDWTESQGGVSGPDAEMCHYFHLTGTGPFRLTRQDFSNLPYSLKLPELILKGRDI